MMPSDARVCASARSFGLLPGGRMVWAVGSRAVFRFLLVCAITAAIGVSLSPPRASADTVGSPCTDWMKIGTDPSSGQQVFCAGHVWQPWSKGAWGSLAIVGPAGSPCNAASFAFAQSSDDYVVWCLRPPVQTKALLPGGRQVKILKTPVWGLYSP